MKLRDWLWIVGLALLVMAVNVGMTVLYMVVYGYVLNPGQPEQHYQDHVQVAGPWCSIIAGAPLFYLAGRWLTRRWPAGQRVAAALLVAVAYGVIDLAILAAAGLPLGMVGFVVVSLGTKLIAAYMGGSAARQAGR
ncbi:MAG: hypothetical protein ACKV2V_14430 [Blastocatellia bacterium]